MLTNEEVIYGFILGGLALVILKTLVGRRLAIVGFDLCRPLSLYGFFYLLYYVVPGLLLLLNDYLPQHDVLAIALLMCVGYAAFWTGLKLSGLRVALRTGRLSISGIEARSLLILCVIGILLVVTYNAWRISIGQFYTHAAFYAQRPTVFASFMDVFASQFQLPLILLLGLLAGVTSTKGIGTHIQNLLYLYSAAIFTVFVISSQARMAVTALVFCLVAKRMFEGPRLKLRYIMLTGVLSFFAITLVQGFRSTVESEDIAESKNQLTFSLNRALPSLLGALDDWGSVVQSPTIVRATGQPLFLSEVIDAAQRGVAYPYGKDIVNSMYAIVPRFAWPSKPDVQPFQLIIRERYRLEVHDDAPGPLVEFFAEGGWPGVLVGFFTFGCALGLLTQRTLSSRSVGLWIILIWVWSAAAQAETELVLGIATTLRNALFVYLIYKILVTAAQWFPPGRMARLPRANCLYRLSNELPH